MQFCACSNIYIACTLGDLWKITLYIRLEYFNLKFSLFCSVAVYFAENSSGQLYHFSYTFFIRTNININTLFERLHYIR